MEKDVKLRGNRKNGNVKLKKNRKNGNVKKKRGGKRKKQRVLK